MWYIQVKGLYMVGASARPGNGVPLVMIGADLAAKRVVQDIREGNV
jgi:phytoene dehydrogenase-like protein